MTNLKKRQIRTAGPARRSAAEQCSLASPYALGLFTRPHPAPGRFHVPVGTECFTSVSDSEPFLAWWLVRARVRRNTGRHGQPQRDARSVHARNGFVCEPFHCFAPPSAYAMAWWEIGGVVGAHGSLPQPFFAAGCACRRAAANYANLCVPRECTDCLDLGAHGLGEVHI